MDEFKIINGLDVSIDDIEQAIELDKIVYDEEYFVSLDQCLEWNEVNNQIYTMIKEVNSNSVIAYVNISPVTDEYYEKIKSGEFIDTYLPAEAIMSYDMPSVYNIYFSSIVIHPNYQNTRVFKMLYDAIIEKIIKLGENDMYIKRMVADAVSDKGMKFCQLFGMEKVKNSHHNSTIYEVEMIPPHFRVSSRATKELYSFYKNVADMFEYEEKNELIDDKQVKESNIEIINDNDSFDVFLSYKNTDSSGNITKEAHMAAELYRALMKRGINTFYSGETLEIMGAAQYKKVIDEALDKTQILIAVGTSVENLNSQWVRYEWDSFSNDILSGLKNDKAAVFSYIDEINAHMLPRTLRQSQVFEKNTSSLDDVCNYIENALGKEKRKPNTTLSSPETKSDIQKVSFSDLKVISQKFIKKSFKTALIEEQTSSWIEKMTNEYSRLFSAVSKLKHGTDVIELNDDLIYVLYDAICNSKSENIVKIMGNSGSEKNALMQLLYLKLCQEVETGKSDVIPFYINLSYYEKQFYDREDKIEIQIRAKMVEDLSLLKKYISENTDKKVVLFIDSIRDFAASQTLIEHILADIISDIKNLQKIIAVDTNFTINKRRIKKVIALAPTNFEYIVKIQSVDLADDEVCIKYYDSFETIYGIKVRDLHDKMVKMSFYEIDAYVLRLSANIIRDNLYNDSFTISDLYEAMCTEMVNGNKNLILDTAKIAYDFAYTEREFNDYDVFSSKQWTIIKRHKSFIDFLISYYYTYQLVGGNEWDLNFFELVLPKEVTRFVTPRINDTFGNEEKVIKLVKEHYSEMEILGKSEMTFWLGRIKNRRLAIEANQMLKEFYSDTLSDIKEKNANNLYCNIGERKADLFLLRGIVVSLIYNEEDKIANTYIETLIDEDLPNEINRGFHLEYYGDKPYLPNKDMLDFEDNVSLGHKTFKRLVKNIDKHFEKRVAMPAMELDLFTMCSLLQARISQPETFGAKKLDYYVDKCLKYLEQYDGMVKHMHSTKISSYFSMIYTDLSEYISTHKRVDVRCDLYNLYSTAVNVKRTGWVNAGIPDPESIVEHMYNAWLLGMFNLPDEYYDPDYSKTKILSMILLHDLGETITGDIPKPEKVLNASYEKKEDKVMRELFLKGTYPYMTNLNQCYVLWEEWNEQRTLNARVAKDLDTLQAMYKFCEYYKDHSDKFSDEKKESWLNEFNDLKTEIGLDIYNKLIKNNSKFSFLFS